MSSLNSRNNSLCSDVAYMYWNNICDIEPLSPEEQKRLLILTKAGDTTARDALIESFLRLVVSRAKKYCHDFDSFMDLVQEGNLGLIAAAERFDADMGCSFSTYATFWIDKYIRRESSRTGKPIRIPDGACRLINQLNVVVSEFTQIKGRTPTVDELANILHISASQVSELLLIVKPSVSLSNEIYSSEGASTTLMDCLPDKQTPTPEDTVLANDTKKTLLNLMESNLTEMEATVLKHRFGFSSSGVPETLQEISVKLDITFQGVQRIEKRAIQKLQKLILTSGLTKMDFV